MNINRCNSEKRNFSFSFTKIETISRTKITSHIRTKLLAQVSCKNTFNLFFNLRNNICRTSGRKFVGFFFLTLDGCALSCCIFRCLFSLCDMLSVTKEIIYENGKNKQTKPTHIFTEPWIIKPNPKFWYIHFKCSSWFMSGNTGWVACRKPHWHFYR